MTNYISRRETAMISSVASVWRREPAHAWLEGEYDNIHQNVHV